MKRKSAITLIFVLVALILVAAFIFYQMPANELQPDNVQLAATTETETASETTAPESIPLSEDTYVDKPTGLEINKVMGNHKENDVSVYPVVEWAPISENAEIGQYTDIRLIDLDLYLRGFKEVQFELTEKANSDVSAKFKDIKYTFDGSRLQINFTYETDRGSSEWEIHADNTGEELDISDIGGAEPSTIWGPKKQDGLLKSNYLSYYSTSDGGFQCIDVYLYYSPETGNMYSLHSISPDGPGFNLIHSDEYYLPFAFLYGTSEEIVSEFTIKFGQETKTYSYVVGMKFGDWAKSKYNTDNWRLWDAQVISPDNKYSMFDTDIVEPNVIAAPVRK